MTRCWRYNVALCLFDLKTFRCFGYRSKQITLFQLEKCIGDLPCEVGGAQRSLCVHIEHSSAMILWLDVLPGVSTHMHGKGN